MCCLAWGALRVCSWRRRRAVQYLDDDGVTYPDSAVKGAKMSSCFDAPRLQPQAGPSTLGRRGSAPRSAIPAPANVDPNTTPTRRLRRKLERLAVEDARWPKRGRAHRGEATRLGGSATTSATSSVCRA